MGRRRKDDCNDLEAGVRKCNKCGEWKPLEEFKANAHCYLGRGYTCHMCRRAGDVEYNARHLEKVRARAIQWNNKHPERVRATGARRRALKRQLPAEPVLVMSEHHDRLYKSGRGKCYYCRKTFNWVKKHDPHPAGRAEVHEEHVIPVSRGGSYTRDNIVLSCWRCNLKKHDKTPLEAGLALL